MKTLLRSLACGALCCLAVTSCVYDDYYGYAGAPVGGYYGRSYSSVYSPGFYSPGFSSLSVGYYGGGYPYYGGYGYPYGYGGGSWPYRYTSYGRSYPYYGRSGYDWNRYGSRSYPYAATYSRPSTFRGSTITTTPGIPSVTPRTFTRPSGSSRFSAPSRSVPVPSGRVSRPITTASRALPTASRSFPSASVRSSAAVQTPPASVRANANAAASNSRWIRGR